LSSFCHPNAGIIKWLQVLKKAKKGIIMWNIWAKRLEKCLKMMQNVSSEGWATTRWLGQP